MGTQSRNRAFYYLNSQSDTFAAVLLMTFGVIFCDDPGGFKGALVEEDGLTIVLTPPQLAMVLSNGTFEEPTFSNRAWGSAGAIFGTLEVLGGGALLLMPEPTTLTKFGGGLLTAHGTDTFQAGVRQAWTGLETNTLTNDGATALAELLGVDRATAERIGRGVDLVVPLAVASGLAAARIATIRAGRISLATHEAYGGHTIARHVGLTEE
ncbi:hypothetical protein [Bordetella ansorpii]|uniref:hypothetical protein n=1 Tax=Bordetella ansorpii TaxID=288768 RepID=UPI0012E83908|nr:hypothetical protein [Bordetella ansorpii]